MSVDADSAAAKSFSSTKGPDTTTAECPLKARKVVTLQWDKAETWCSEGGPISGTTKNYPDGEKLSIDVHDHVGAASVQTLDGPISGNAFSSPWDVIDVLPTGGPSWVPRRNLDGETGGIKTPKPMSLRFIPNVKRASSNGHLASYDRTNPPATTPVQVTVKCNFELEAVNYLLTIYGVELYTRGRAGERLFLNAPTLSASGFTYSDKQTWHYGYQDALGNFQYWNGTAFVPTPASFVPGQSNHFGLGFFKKGANWVCYHMSGLTWPVAWTDWLDSDYKGAGNTTDTKLATWKTNIDTTWTDKFDIKRQECKSTKAECCRYKTRCVSTFTETDSASATLIIVLEDVRSDSIMWSMGDTRSGLAPHEFGHLLGAPDEYPGVGTTQLGVTDGDGLVSGIDDNCLMGIGLSEPKKRHYKGICEVLAILVKDQFGKTYTYRAVEKATNLASPPDTPMAADPGPPSDGPGDGSSLGKIIGAIVGGIVGAAAGAAIGFLVSGGNPWATGAGAVGGAVAGALAGAKLGSMF